MEGVKLAFLITGCAMLFFAIFVTIVLCAVYLPKMIKASSLQFDNDEHEKKKNNKKEN